MTAPPGDLNRIRQTCIEILAVIDRELTNSYYHRQIWTEVKDAVVARYPSANAAFINAFTQTYASSQVSTVRRLADHDDNTQSLWQVYEKMRRNPKLIA